MNVALIIAGGVGQRTNQDIPKQFINVFDKPVIIYTLETFESHPDVDAILVVCLDGWHEILKAYAKQFNITKLQWIVSGGENGQGSARNGVYALEDVCGPEDILIIHDAIRPLVSEDLISDCIAKCRLYGSGVASLPCQETVMQTEDQVKSDYSIPRERIMRVQTPQAYRYADILWGHREALKRGITNEVYANTMMITLGKTVYFSVGSERNMKITNAEDIQMFKAMYSMKKSDWLK